LFIGKNNKPVFVDLVCLCSRKKTEKKTGRKRL